MDNRLFEIICEASPEFKEAISFLSMIGEKHNRTLEEELELWGANKLPKVTKRRNRDAIND